MEFGILKAKNNEDAARWTALVASLPAALHDLHYLPEYASIYEDAHGHEGLLAYLTAPDGVILQPFVRRPLAELPFLRANSDRALFTDITNPYGFGGPLASVGSNSAAVPEFARNLAYWCNQENVASEFTCLHPFLQAHQRNFIGSGGTLQHEKNVVFIDLDLNEADLFGNLRKGHRSSITRARRSNVEVQRIDLCNASLELFHNMYMETMKRRCAANRWLLSQEFFAATARRLGDKRVTLLAALVNGTAESACMLIHDFTTAYYHFACTFANYPELGVNNLLVLEAAKHMKAAGRRRLHLGGGVTSDPADSLFRFKAGFSSDRAPLYTYFAVRDVETYDELCRRKRIMERQTYGEESTSSFLPLYRR